MWSRMPRCGTRLGRSSLRSSSRSSGPSGTLFVSTWVIGIARGISTGIELEVHSSMDLPNAEAFLEKGDYQYVRFEQSDLHGLSRSKTIPVPHFRSFAEHGLNFF